MLSVSLSEPYEAVQQALARRKYEVTKEGQNTFVITGSGLTDEAIKDLLNRSVVTNYWYKIIVSQDLDGRQLVQLVPRIPQK